MLSPNHKEIAVNYVEANGASTSAVRPANVATISGALPPGQQQQQPGGNSNIMPGYEGYHHAISPSTTNYPHSFGNYSNPNNGQYHGHVHQHQPGQHQSYANEKDAHQYNISGGGPGTSSAYHNSSIASAQPTQNTISYSGYYGHSQSPLPLPSNQDYQQAPPPPPQPSPDSSISHYYSSQQYYSSQPQASNTYYYPQQESPHSYPSAPQYPVPPLSYHHHQPQQHQPLHYSMRAMPPLQPPVLSSHMSRHAPQQQQTQPKQLSSLISPVQTHLPQSSQSSLQKQHLQSNDGDDPSSLKSEIVSKMKSQNEENNQQVNTNKMKKKEATKIYENQKAKSDKKKKLTGTAGKKLKNMGNKVSGRSLLASKQTKGVADKHHQDTPHLGMDQTTTPSSTTQVMAHHSVILSTTKTVNNIASDQGSMPSSNQTKKALVKQPSKSSPPKQTAKLSSGQASSSIHKPDSSTESKSSKKMPNSTNSSPNNKPLNNSAEDSHDSISIANNSTVEGQNDITMTTPVKRGRGRPRKYPITPPQAILVSPPTTVILSPPKPATKTATSEHASAQPESIDVTLTETQKSTTSKVDDQEENNVNNADSRDGTVKQVRWDESVVSQAEKPEMTKTKKKRRRKKKKTGALYADEELEEFMPPSAKKAKTKANALPKQKAKPGPKPGSKKGVGRPTTNKTKNKGNFLFERMLPYPRGNVGPVVRVESRPTNEKINLDECRIYNDKDREYLKKLFKNNYQYNIYNKNGPNEKPYFPSQIEVKHRESRDESNVKDWICAFCQRGPLVDRLGELYGPYFVKVQEPMPLGKFFHNFIVDLN